MAGHNKWSKVKHIKAKTDAQKGKQFSKVAREIIVAVKAGGPDADMNPRLRLALQKAKEVNMPNDNVKRAIAKGSGTGESDSLEEITFEAYGPNGVALLINTVTDNRNRTVPNIKTILSKGNGSLATKGAVAYLFSKKGQFYFEDASHEDSIMEIAMEHDADDIVSNDDGSIEVLCDPGQFDAIKTGFDTQSIAYATAGINQIPSTTVALDTDQSKKIITLIEKLEDDDDVQDVFGNFELADDTFDD